MLSRLNNTRAILVPSPSHCRKCHNENSFVILAGIRKDDIEMHAFSCVVHEKRVTGFQRPLFDNKRRNSASSINS